MRLSRSYLPIIFTFIISVAVSVTLFVIMNNWEQEHERIEFESRSRGYAYAIQGNLNKYLEALSFLGDFFNNSQQVTRQEFALFTESVLSRHPGIQAFSWNPLVMGNDRAAYESLARKEGTSNFRFTEKTKEGALVDAAQRQEYVVVYYIEPLETNKHALGYNIASEAIRLQAIDQAFQTGKVFATGRITLVQETGTQSGCLILLPLYQQGVSLKTLEARLKYRKGLAVEVLRIGDVVRAALKPFPDEGINIHLYDASAKNGARLLYASPSLMPGATEQPTDEEVIQKGLHWSKNFEFAGHQWKMMFSPSPSFFDSKHTHTNSWLILSGSLFLTAILLLYLFKKINYTIEIEWRIKEQLQTNQELANEITERNKAEDALLASQTALIQSAKMAAVGTLAGGIAHEVNNPLTGILTYVQLMQSKFKAGTLTTDKVIDYAGMVEDITKHCVTTIRNLLDFSRESKEGAQPQSLSDIIDASGLLMFHQLELQNIKVSKNIEDITITVNKSYLMQVFVNMLTNARDAMPKGGEITISARKINGHADIVISDTGTGIPEADLPLIFDPFFTTKEVGKGTGIGLYMCHQIVKDMGGTTEVKSEVGKGTTFTFKLPVGGK